MNIQTLAEEIPAPTLPDFPLNQWYVAALGWELKDKPVGRTLLNKPSCCFANADGEVAALEDRCCHRALPLSSGTLEERGMRCGYHGLLFAERGKCVEIPGQDRIPSKAKVPPITWSRRIRSSGSGWAARRSPSRPASRRPTRSTAWQVHVRRQRLPLRRALSADPRQPDGLEPPGLCAPEDHRRQCRVHMNARMNVESEGDRCGSCATCRTLFRRPPTRPPGRSQATSTVGRKSNFTSATCDLDRCGRCRHRDLDDPDRGGFHMRGFQGSRRD